jgi:PAS domain-containing protein
VNERVVAVLDFIEEHKKSFGIIGVVLVFIRKTYRKMMDLIKTGKRILIKIEEATIKIDALQKDISEIKTEASITNALIKTSKDLEDIGVFETNHRGEITWVNSYILRKLGVQREDFIRNRWQDYINKSVAEQVVFAWKAKVSQSDKIHIQTDFYANNGELVPVVITAHPINVNDMIYGYAGTMKMS